MEIEHGKIPPRAVEIEKAVLGAVLLDKDVIDDVYSIQDSEEYFYNERYKAIYRAILDLYRVERSIDMLTVVDQLRSTENLQVAGGAASIANLTSGVASSLHVREHCAIVKQQAVRREMIKVGTEIANKGYDETIDVADLVSYGGDLVEKITESLYGGLYPWNETMDDVQREDGESMEHTDVDGAAGIPTNFESVLEVQYHHSNRIPGSWSFNIGKWDDERVEAEI